MATTNTSDASDARTVSATSRPAAHVSRHRSTPHTVAGAVSGLVTCILLQPFDLLKTRLQQQPLTARSVPTGSGSVWRVLRQVLQQDGMIGLWRGTVPTLVRWVTPVV
jgi:solute carrier family 25 protein 38